MIKGLCVPVIPLVKPSGAPTPVEPAMAVRSKKDQTECHQNLKTPRSGIGKKIYMTSTAKLVEEGSASWAGVTKVVLNTPSIRRRNATKFAWSRISKSTLRRERGASGQLYMLLHCTELSAKIKFMLMIPSVLSLFHHYLCHCHCRQWRMSREDNNFTASGCQQLCLPPPTAVTPHSRNSGTK